MVVSQYIRGDRGGRTPNLGIANAALSQLSYIPETLDTSEFYQAVTATSMIGIGMELLGL